MRRGSFIGPILLVLIGVAFLVNNLRPDLSILQMVGDHWPYLLIAWGTLRLVEITVWRLGGRQTPANGVSGGEWVLIVFLCVIGSGIFYGQRFRDRIPGVSARGLEFFGESYDYTLEEKKMAAGRTPRVMVENLRGNARISGGDTEEVRASGHAKVKAFSQADGDRMNKECPFEIVKQGDLTVIRTNHDRATHKQQISADLEITVPRGASLEARGRYGDFDITGLAGNAVVESDNAGVRMSNIGGNVRVETKASDIVRLVNIKGNVEAKGRGQDVELDGVEGQATISGSYHGDLTFRKIAKPLRFEGPSTEVRTERIAGVVQFDRGRLNMSDVLGPVFVKAKSKDVTITDFTQGLEVDLERGDIEIRPGKLPLARMEIKTRAGHVELALPAGARYDLRAQTEQGEIENDLGAPTSITKSGIRGQTAQWIVAGGTPISVSTRRGNVTIRKSTGSTPVPPSPPAAPKAPVRVDQ